MTSASRYALSFAVTAFAVLASCGKDDTPRPPPDSPVLTADFGAIDWVDILAGRFDMGSDSGDPDERPVHSVTIRAFAMARTETTVDQYKRCVDAGVCIPPRPLRPKHCTEEQMTWNKADKGNHPVNCVTWHQAQAFCEWANGRLPTEAEWEFAARGIGNRIYPWGNEIPRAMPAPVGNFADASLRDFIRALLEKNRPATAGKLLDLADLGLPNWPPIDGYNDGFAGTAPVGSFPAGRSPFGLDDMAGNLREWVADWYAPYSPVDSVDPKGPVSETDGRGRVDRGASFEGGGGPRPNTDLRTSGRVVDGPERAVYLLGFRCARSTR